MKPNKNNIAMKNKNIVLILVVLIGLTWGLLSSCDSQTSIYEQYIVPNGLIYPGPAHTVKAYPGYKRIKIAWLKSTDPRVQKAKIFWNNYTDSVEVPITANMDTISYIIEPIEENTYTFMIHTYDSEGNKSIPVEVLGEVYGDKYKDMLINRQLRDTYYDGQYLKLTWGNASDSEVGVRVSWTDNNGANRSTLVDAETTETLIPNFNFDHPLSYCTVYMPDSFSIDLIEASLVEKKIEPLVLLPKDTWNAISLPGDIEIRDRYPLKNLWNDNTADFMHSADPITLPGTFTFDLGVKVKLSKMKIWPRKGDDRWNRGHPRVFEVYGSLDPNPDGSLDASWTLLGKFECVQPSGNGIATPWVKPTQEDIELSDNGLDFEFTSNESEQTAIAIRYFRFKSIEHFNPTASPRILLAEISLWGMLVK